MSLTRFTLRDICLANNKPNSLGYTVIYSYELLDNVIYSTGCANKSIWTLLKTWNDWFGSKYLQISSWEIREKLGVEWSF